MCQNLKHLILESSLVDRDVKFALNTEEFNHIKLESIEINHFFQADWLDEIIEMNADTLTFVEFDYTDIKSF